MHPYSYSLKRRKHCDWLKPKGKVVEYFMMEDRLQVLDVDVAVDAPTRTRTTSQVTGNQTIAICNKTHVVAIANGCFVDLYTSSVNTSHPFAFLHQISIREHVNHSPTSRTIGNVASGENIVEVTSSVFPVSGFLLVGAFVEAENSGSDDSVETHRKLLLFGFRLYASSVSKFVSIGSGEDARQTAASVQVHLSFVEPVVGISGTAIQCLQRCRREMTADAGAVVLLFDGSELLGVFSWKERFSDRQVSLGRLKQKFSRLVCAECSPDGRYLIIGDAEGRTALLDFQDFSWSGVEESSMIQHKYGGKRLELGVTSRSGVIKRDNPLENVRLVHVAASAGTSCAFSSMCWWIVGVRDQQKQFIFAGKRDGSLTVFKLIQGNDEASSVIDLKMVQMYPGLASGTHDVVRSITEPMKIATSNNTWFEFYTISEMRWRTWRITIEEVDDGLCKRYRMIWPSVKESLEFPTYMIQANALNGIDMFSVSTEFSQNLAKALFDSTPEYEARYPIVLVVADSRLQMIGLLTKTPVDSMSKSEGSVSVSELENGAEKSDHEEAKEEIDDAETEMSEDKKCCNGPNTIQDKYKLPPMEWKAKGSIPAPVSQNGEGSETRNIGSGSTAQVSKLSRVDYDKRVTSVMQRVETLSGVMKSMRTSFQLFSSDVQQHMNLVSEQLEEISRRRVTQETAQSSRT